MALDIKLYIQGGRGGVGKRLGGIIKNELFVVLPDDHLVMDRNAHTSKDACSRYAELTYRLACCNYLYLQSLIKYLLWTTATDVNKHFKATRVFGASITLYNYL